MHKSQIMVPVRRVESMMVAGVRRGRLRRPWDEELRMDMTTLEMQD